MKTKIATVFVALSIALPSPSECFRLFNHTARLVQLCLMHIEKTGISAKVCAVQTRIRMRARNHCGLCGAVTACTGSLPRTDVNG